MTSRLGVLAAATLLLVLGACGDTASNTTSASPSASASASATPSVTGAAAGLSYVALGDSYTAGPLIPDVSSDSGLCLRSTHNYPSDLVRDLGFGTHTDVSCSGATTADVLHGKNDASGKTVLPAQLDAVTSSTNVVTVGIGGNDDNLFATLVGECPRVARSDPSGHPCEDAVGGRIDAMVADAQAGVADVLTAVHRKAPRATVVLVGYLSLVPTRGTCKLLPFATGDYPWARAVQARLDDAMAAAAKQTRTPFVSMRKASEGHDACAGADAWVNGSTTDARKAYAFHPFASGMAAVAKAVETTLASHGIG